MNLGTAGLSDRSGKTRGIYRLLIAQFPTIGSSVIPALHYCLAIRKKNLPGVKQGFT